MNVAGVRGGGNVVNQRHLIVRHGSPRLEPPGRYAASRPAGSADGLSAVSPPRSPEGAHEVRRRGVPLFERSRLDRPAQRLDRRIERSPPRKPFRPVCVMPRREGPWVSVVTNSPPPRREQPASRRRPAARSPNHCTARLLTIRSNAASPGRSGRSPSITRPRTPDAPPSRARAWLARYRSSASRVAPAEAGWRRSGNPCRSPPPARAGRAERPRRFDRPAIRHLPLDHRMHVISRRRIKGPRDPRRVGHQSRTDRIAAAASPGAPATSINETAATASAHPCHAPAPKISSGSASGSSSNPASPPPRANRRSVPPSPPPAPQPRRAEQQPRLDPHQRRRLQPEQPGATSAASISGGAKAIHSAPRCAAP